MASKGNGTTFDQMPYQKPVERGRWEAIRLGIYNPSTHEVLGRTCGSWAALMLFYGVFYVVLAAFFAVCMKGMLHTIDEKVPYFTQGYSLIGSNPGLGFRPISPDPERDGSLIWYNHQNASNVKIWTDRIEEFLKPYKNPNLVPGGTLNQMECDYRNEPKPGKTCVMHMEQYAPCTERNQYGYPTSSPCIFLKLNKIYGWKPDYYKNENDFPEGMPKYLKGNVTELLKRNSPEANTVWVSCQGENPHDRDNIREIKMYPKFGIPGFYFPYENQEGYLSPVVAVQIRLWTLGVLTSIECRAWANNIQYKRHNTLREGSVRFEIMIDEYPKNKTDGVASQSGP